MFVYYSLKQARNQDVKGPDFFAVLGVPKGERLSWVCWEEGKTPDVVIELLLNSTALVNKGEKKDIYATQLHVPEYFWYDPMNPEDWPGFRLQSRHYEPIALEGDRLESQSPGLWLTRWHGQFKGIEATWLRWADANGCLLLTPTEQERRRADDGAAQVRQIVRNLLQRGMTAEEVAEVTGVSLEQIKQMG